MSHEVGRWRGVLVMPLLLVAPSGRARYSEASEKENGAIVDRCLTDLLGALLPRAPAAQLSTHVSGWYL